MESQARPRRLAALQTAALPLAAMMPPTLPRFGCLGRRFEPHLIERAQREHVRRIGPDQIGPDQLVANPDESNPAYQFVRAQRSTLRRKCEKPIRGPKKRR